MPYSSPVAMDPTRNPAADTDFDFDAWVRWQHLTHAWHSVSAARRKATRHIAPVSAAVPPAPEEAALLPVPN
ncbi:hypothetical protein [Hymenobacter elongatus]|uniref:Uncharacterized protein n=1 Tax=Hymenobacter elongatus TaxID=877208 RepID=A0A4Z0PP93_9BACT|nr:hypothetical protein [Hymenobacter elongatus]TGE17806.1 hypothetical protein E5J99_06330 [Hymenobacter elongatus]